MTVDGGEIGRAQALQAIAAGLTAHTDMNPVLLKPSSNTGAQVIIHGVVRADMNARDYQQYKSTAMEAVLESYGRLRVQYEVVIVEGAGSPAEINLRARDIANMGFAEAVDCPVILVADIDRGGVFAHIVGTMACLSESERARVVGFVINRFRGDLSLLDSGLEWLERQTGKPVLAVLPYLQGLFLDAEDGVDAVQASQGAFKVIVPHLPRMSNHTDFDALRAHPDVDLHFAGGGLPIPAGDLVVIPGTKNTRGDLEWMLNNGWDKYLERHLRYGGKVIGICGGYQMLGRSVADPHGVEGAPGTSTALGLLDIDTTLTTKKRLVHVSGVCAFADAAVSGYEIHMGESHGAGLERPAFTIDGRDEGALSADGQILGSYLHGMFDTRDGCAALLRWAGLESDYAVDTDALRDASLNRIAETVRPLLAKLIEHAPPRPA